MEFGKVSNVDQVNFSFPPSPPQTEELLTHAPSVSPPPKVYLGCPTWKEKSFVGKIYPSHSKEKDFLKYYSRQFNTIEMNNTYYGLPGTKTIANWAAAVEKDFRFCPKLPATISHEKQLQNAQPETQEFCQAMELLKAALGTTFLLVPPEFGPDRLPVLERYLQNFPRQIPLAIELRHPAWFRNSNHHQAVFQLLQKYQIHSIITDVAGRRDVLHQRLTTPTAVIRFVGNNLHPSDYRRIDDWIERLNHWFNLGLHQAYFFIHQYQRELAIDLAIYFAKKMTQLRSVAMREPSLIQEEQQQSFDF